MRHALGRPRPAPRMETGSAYMIVISALAILSLIGLTLLAVTQTDVAIGSSERNANRVFYAADSGFAVATARALAIGDYAATTFTVPDSVSGSPISSSNQVVLSPFCPINDQPCNLCDINDAGEYSDHSYRKINHAETTTATRTAVPLSNLLGPLTTVAQKQLTSMFDIQPMKASTDAYAACTDPTQIKF